MLSAMRGAGVAPNTRSYNALLAACDRGRQPERALEVLHRMQREAKGAPVCCYDVLNHFQANFKQIMPLCVESCWGC